MKRLFSAILLLTAFFDRANADHITGGEMYYTYGGFSNGLHRYNVTYKLFMRCHANRSFADPATISVFDRSTNTRIADISVSLGQQTNISLPGAGPCISNPPEVCYEVGYYYFSVDLPPSQEGYLLASQVNYRINGISNLLLTSGLVGATYSCEIPGTGEAGNGPENSSAVFTGSDLVVVCAGNFFSYSFAAQDADGDQLRYFFCSAYNSSSTGPNGTAAADPPFLELIYSTPFHGAAPLGSGVGINGTNGLITGLAPPQGVYVVTVCVQEIRNGIILSTQRKDIQINVADCNVAAAMLQPDYMLCRGPETITINNLSQSPLINSYDWTVINPANTIIHTTNTPTLTFTFPAPGTYTIKLTVNRSQECSDSTTTRVYFYPGFIPDFNYTGICITKPTAFTDNTSSVTGTVNSWNWDFGDAGSTLDISNIRNPVYTYPSLGTRDVTLTVTNTDGCRDTIVKSISIIDKPPINFAFRDTLICVNDQVQLQASGMGVFSWSPNINIVDANTANPIVFPITSTTYYVDLNSDGCLNRDSVKIRVVDHVSLQMMADTSICRGDTVRLRVVSDGLHFAWTPVSQLIDATAKQPLAIPAAITPYQVTATIGSCSANGHVTVTTVPRPTADAGSNMSICYNSSTQLNGSTDGESWQWTPASSLSNSTALNPIATPVGTTSYVFTTYDYTRGCPKPGSDTVVITVLPRIFPSAGNDTAVIVNQELQLQASGGSGYLWVPGANLSASNIANPIAIFREPSNGIPYKVKVFNEAGCADSALIIIKVFATQPTVFVPTAFTPNNDGKNDELLPIAVGMKHIEYFNVYNRWGQLVFTSAINGKGWDGRISGQLQGSNTYVWIVKAIDFRDMPYFLKGSSTLIR